MTPNTRREGRMKSKRRKRKYFVVQDGKSVEVKRLPKDAPNLLGPIENWNTWAERNTPNPFLNGPTIDEDCLP